ncbi:MAG: dienelactone hydrolase family protein [Candidatus Omnitrophica bacterium]|nr:dienelactone hydrolase family protein [Candidatus Omnitrophota bacterium]MDD5553245.1 dienelactone hydrolase family protein [Candidatus Omnitrophota bacterium]
MRKYHGRMPLKIIFSVIIIFSSLKEAQAVMRTQPVEYRDGDTVLEGYLVYDDLIKAKVPGVLIVHEWSGIGDYVKRRAEQIASLGYVAFAVDIYGKGIRPKNTKEAAVQAGIYRADRRLMRRRARAGLEELKRRKIVDPARIAAVGYCFGGGVALELARSGAGISGAVSFHGNLDTPRLQDAKNIKAKILVCHGADDPHVPWEQVKTFVNEMRIAGCDWQMNIYGNAVHSFTNPDSGDDPKTGAAYNKEADARSWEAMESFLNEVFAKGRLR